MGDEQISGESTPSVSGRIFRGGYTVQEHINQLEERIHRLQHENQTLRSEITETVEKLQSKESEYHEIDAVFIGRTPVCTTNFGHNIFSVGKLILTW